ncbi:MAG: hypothetical protein HC854_10985 [Flavobacterium sp.]|nr:hypothetical protein [Flavobacterium sp.]
MSIPELKNIIKQKIDNADERVLRIIASVLEEYSREIVSYDAKNYPLDIEEYNYKVEEGFEDIKNNRLLSNAEMKLKIKQLKNR